MGLLSIFRSSQLDPEWAYDANGIIWRVHFTDHKRIIGECRNQDKKLASFFCLDEESGKSLWRDLSLEEPWWVGIEAVLSDVVLLHTYGTPDMPGHRGIRALDTGSGTLLWRNDDITFWFGQGESVFAYRDFFERRVGYELSLRTGENRRTFDGSLEELHEIRRLASGEQPSSGVVLPEILQGDAEDASIFSIVRRFTKGREIVGNIEFIVEGEFLLFNYHAHARDSTGESPKLDNELNVIRFPGGTRIYSDVIGRNLKASVPDAFFIRRPRLFFIKDQQVLTSVRLWRS